MSGSGARPAAPRRPSLGPLAPAAIAAWGAAIAVEQASWRAYTGSFDSSAASLALGALACAALPLWLLARGFGRGKRRGEKAGAAAGGRRGGGDEPRGLDAASQARGLRGGCARAKGKGRPILVASAVAAVACFACAACSTLYWQAWAGDVALLADSALQDVRIELTGDVSSRDYGNVSTGRAAVDGRRVSVRVLWPDDVAEIPGAGHAVTADALYTAPQDDEGGSWNHRNGYAGMLRLSDVRDAGAAGGLSGLVSGFRDSAFRSIEQRGGDGAALLAGLLLGNRTLYAGSELEQDFKTCGLAHLMAVSGTHLAVVTAIFSWLLARTPLAWRGRCVVLACALGLYVALTGFSPSAMRAAVMCVVALSAAAGGRRKHVCTALSLCVLAFIALDPANAYSLSFVLSVLAVLGLVVLGPLASCWVAHVAPARLSKAASGIGVTLAATLATLPVTVPMFAQFPLIVPFATLVAAPPVTLALGAGVVALLVGVAVPVLGDLVLSFAVAVSSASAFLVHAMADIPLACIPLDAAAAPLALVSATLAVALWAAWPLPASAKDASPAPWRPSAGRDGTRLAHRVGGRALVCACLCLPFFALVVHGMANGSGFAAWVGVPDAAGPQVVMLDVGQGDALLVRDGEAAVLVDTGEEADALARGLARHGVTHLDAVFVSHKDSDHVGALSGIVGVVGIDHVYVHADLLSAPGEAQVLESARRATAGRGAEGVRPGSTCRAGAFTIEVLAPEDGGESGNDDSLQMLVSCDANGDGQAEARGFTSGDAEADAIAATVDEVGDVDFVKVPHHGSRGGMSAEELAILSPQVALIGVGADNSYGHPTRQMLDLLAQARAKVYRTDENGDVTLRFTDGSMEVAVQRDES